MTAKPSLTLQVEQAFTQARAGNFEPSSQLQQLGESIIPLLKPYLSDPNEDIRRQVIALLGTLTSDSSLPLLATALLDLSPDIQQRASLILYQHYSPTALMAYPAIGQALQQSVKNGNETGPAVLLLGYVPGPNTLRILHKLLTSEALTEVFAWTPVVAVAFISTIALSRLGEQDARYGLINRIENGDLNELSFLLYSLRDIDSPHVLHALKTATFDDEREITGDLPSGITPQIRLQDLAVTMFVRQLNIPVDFDVSGTKRYSLLEIQQARDAFDALVPQ